jgi:hypothetical protein
MLTALHQHRRVQLAVGFVLGAAFGFLLHRGGATEYDVIIGQLLLEDFTVVKIMFSAVVTGMVGVHALRGLGVARLHPKTGSWGSSGLGGLLFGVGFAVLGYCPGTVAAAVGRGALDALLGGVPGILLGAGLYAAAYPFLRRTVLSWGDFGEITLPELLRLHPWAVVPPFAGGLALFLYALERGGF